MGWYCHLVERGFPARDHSVVVMDLPVDDGAATLSDHADVVVEAIATLPTSISGPLLMVRNSFLPNIRRALVLCAESRGLAAGGHASEVPCPLRETARRASVERLPQHRRSVQHFT